MPRSVQSRANARPQARLRCLPGPFTGLAGLCLVGATAAWAQAPAASQPVVDFRGLTPPPCPLVVPVSDAVLQPLRLQPAQVADKNAMGCLSAADAIDGPEGCPLQLCSTAQGTLPMPASP